jgi:hypothetical protein
MGVVASLLEDVRLPRMVRARQLFTDDALPDVAGALRAEIARPAIAGRIRSGMRVALAVGSRGLADLPLLVKVTVEELRARGASPFIVPGMGSHGGATAAGQASVLAALGVTEASAGCPILSSMETVELGVLENGLPVLMDANAMRADGIVLLNRVKPHTSFSGPVESGLVKMMAIGLGKQRGADSCHALGFGHMARNIVDMARVKLRKAPFLFGIATVENAYDRIAEVVAVPAEEIVETEERLLVAARQAMPSILFRPLDVLVVDRMGKEFSGTGTDPNITGRAATPYVATAQEVARMVILDLSDASHGNATGLGLADVVTRRLFDKMDLEATYANHLTSTVLAHAKIPVMMASDRQALQAAVKTCNVRDPDRVRMVRIRNTLHLDTIRLSESLLDEARRHPQIALEGAPEEWQFDERGDLRERGDWR